MVVISNIAKTAIDLTGFFFVFVLVFVFSVEALEPIPVDDATAAKKISDVTSPVKTKKLLFVPFHNQTGDANSSWLETSIGYGIHEAARRKYRYTKIDDDTFLRYFASKGYVPADLSDFEKIAKIARELGADGVIYGTFTPDASKAQIVVTGKILSVIDQEIVAEKTLTMPVSAEMFSGVEEVSRVLGENIRNLFFPSDAGALKRAAVLPGWGHWYKQRRDWAYAYGIAFWSSLAFTAFATIQYFHFKSAYSNFNPDHYTNYSGGTRLFDSASAQAEFDRYAANTNTYGTLALAGALTMVAIYAANLLHAWIITPEVGDSVNLIIGGRASPAQLTGGMPWSMEVSLAWKF